VRHARLILIVARQVGDGIPFSNRLFLRLLCESGANGSCDNAALSGVDVGKVRCA
jgi:hypothetical protein